MEILTADEAQDWMHELVSAAHKPLSEPENVARHWGLCQELHDLYAAKNADYGDAFSIGFRKYGPTMALIRMEDKLARFERLSRSPDGVRVKSESIRDTLMDLANYAVMTVMAVEESKKTFG